MCLKKYDNINKENIKEYKERELGNNKEQETIVFQLEQSLLFGNDKLFL